MGGQPEIRATIAGDRSQLQALYDAAFPAETLFPLVERLLAHERGILSLAAVIEDRCVGHILFTQCGVGDRRPRVALLGPLAVAPASQRQGIGSALVREGLGRLRRTGLRQALVLGDPAYYRRFSFGRETAVMPPYDLPAPWSDAWQSVLLEDDAPGLLGRLCPPAPWLSPSLWAP
jgi:putative acetyltransferase